MKTIKTIKQLLWASLPALLLLLSACSTEFDSTPEVATEVYKVAKFSFPDNGYTIAINGTPADSVVVDREKSKLVTINKPFWVEVTKEGQQLFADSVTYNESGIITFYDVVGHSLMPLTAEEQHSLSVSVAEPAEGVKILVKGIEGNPQGVEITNGAPSMLSQADVAKGGLTIEVSKGGEVLYNKLIEKDANASKINLLWAAANELIALNPPTDEQREQLEKEGGIFVSFMFSSKDYPQYKSLIVEAASDLHLELNSMGEGTAVLKEGATATVYEIFPDAPSEFKLFSDFEDYTFLSVIKLYDPEKPDEPLQTTYDFFEDASMKVLNFSYDQQAGESDYKFRCFKFVPSSSPDFPAENGDINWMDPVPLFQPMYSFK